MITIGKEYRCIDSRFVLVTTTSDVDNPITTLPGTTNTTSVSDTIAVLYDKDAGVVVTHGDRAVVAQTHYKIGGALGKSLILATSRNWDIAELNKLIATPGYVKTFHAKYYDTAVKA